MLAGSTEGGFLARCHRHDVSPVNLRQPQRTPPAAAATNALGFSAAGAAPASPEP